MGRNNDLNMINVTRASMPPFEEYIEAIKPLWDSHWLTNMGVYHKQLEKELAKYLEVPEISLMINGHMALELAIQSFSFPEGKEIITTPFTFISTTHAIVRNRLKPVFCDVKEEDGTIDETKIEELINENTVAILPVHVYGNICNVKEIQRIANKYDLRVIYDAAHAFGEVYGEQGVGNYGDASIFSFHATKVFNTIEGGAVVCRNHEIYEKLYDLKNFGIRSEELVTSIGANAKMNEFSAIMGLCNLNHISEVIDSRRRITEKYFELLEDCDNLRILKSKVCEKENYSYFPVCFTGGSSCLRDDVYNYLKKNSINTRKYFYPITSDQACFKNKYRNIDLPIARSLSERVLALPLYESMTEDIVESVCRMIKEVIGV